MTLERTQVYQLTAGLIAHKVRNQPDEFIETLQVAGAEDWTKTEWATMIHALSAASAEFLLTIGRLSGRDPLEIADLFVLQMSEEENNGTI